MSRPPISVVMPFAGSRAEAGAALEALRGLRTSGEDELILADNSGTAPDGGGVLVVPAAGERSPSHARNAGAARARRDWILFLDADCRAPADLLDRFFAEDVADDVGALAGGVVAAPGADGLAASYGAAKNFLNQDAHLAHGYMARAAAANLMVRRQAFRAVGGFYEGVRAAEDTDFSWRLQRAGWRLEGRPQARVEHRYRTTLRSLRRQWRGYAAGRAWLARRYEDFEPEPALKRAGRPRAASPGPGARPDAGIRLSRVRRIRATRRAGSSAAASWRSTRCWESRSWRGSRSPTGRDGVAGCPPGWSWSPTASRRWGIRWPTSRCRSPALRVEAAARPDVVRSDAARGLTVDYREDDGAAARVVATAPPARPPPAALRR